MQDHGGGTNVYGEVAKKLDAKYASQGIHVYFCDEVYAKAQGDFDKWLAANGYPVSSHAGIPERRRCSTSAATSGRAQRSFQRRSATRRARRDSRSKRSAREQRNFRRRSAFDAGARKEGVRPEGRLRGSADPRIPRDEMIMSDSRHEHHAEAVRAHCRRGGGDSSSLARSRRATSRSSNSRRAAKSCALFAFRRSSNRTPSGGSSSRRSSSRSRDRREPSAPFSGAYWDLHDKGLFRCLCCDTALFSSAVKFDSGTGWPSFWQPIAEENVQHGKPSGGYVDSEVTCRRCDAHLGDLFDDGPKPTGCGTASTPRRSGSSNSANAVLRSEVSDLR